MLSYGDQKPVPGAAPTRTSGRRFPTLKTMLTAAPLGIRAESTRTRRARPLPSLKQRYHEYLLQRIEDYKNSLARDELLKLGNDAASELHAAAEGQYYLTEIVMQETGDKLI